MISIPLTQNKTATVDDADAELALSRWCTWRGPKNKTCYALRKSRLPDGRATTEKLHRAVWNRAHPEAPAPHDIDHINGDGLDCRRSNLRAASRSENARNQPRTRANTSGFVGVRLMRNRPRPRAWQAYIGIDRRKVHVGCFATAEEAARARDAAARQLHGVFAVFNFPAPGERSAG